MSHVKTQDVHPVWSHLEPFQVGTKTLNATMNAVVADEDVSAKIVMYPDAKNEIGTADLPSEPTTNVLNEIHTVVTW